jgi:hypothetical protein
MRHISELQKTLSDFFDWHKARISCLTQILRALFCVKTVNLAQIATAFQTNSQEESAYRRICRFFTGFSFDLSTIVPLVLRVFSLQGKHLLIIDRTNWKWGKSPINILMLSVAYLGISIPLFWAVLDLDGTSCLEDRSSLLEQVLEKFGLEKIEAVVADREFVGKEWFNFLIEKKIPFVIRVKGKFMAEGIRHNYPVPLQTLCKQLGRRKNILNYPVILWGYKLYISLQWKKNAEEPMIVASNLKFEDALEIYRRRWEIETLFGCLKTRGFRMEDTHITDADKIEKLIFVLAIAFCWSYRTGEIRAKVKPIPIKTHGRKARSLFREGMNLIRRAMLGVTSTLRELRKLLLCFSNLKSRPCNV